MVDTFTFLILVGISWIILLTITNNKWYKLKNPDVGLGYLMYRTKTFNIVLDKFAGINRSLWRIFFDIGLLVCFGFLLASVFMFSVNFLKFLEQLAINAGYLPKPSPQNAIQTLDFVPAIPGISIGFETLPYFFVAIAIAAALHELSHGVAARAENIDLKSTGLLFFLFFFGAFVEPDEKSLKKAKPRAKLRVYAAGAFTNVVLVLVLLIFITPVFFNAMMGPFYATNPSGALVVDVCPTSVSECGARNILHSNDVIIQAQYQNTTDVNIRSDLDFSIFASQLKANETINLTLLDQSNPVTIKTTPYPGNTSRGLIGISVTNYYHPAYSFLPLQMPYWYLRTISITIALSLILALVNLLPVPPLDGDKIASEIIQYFSKSNYKFYLKWVRIATLVIILGNLVLTFVVKGWTPI